MYIFVNSCKATCWNLFAIASLSWNSTDYLNIMWSRRQKFLIVVKNPEKNERVPVSPHRNVHWHPSNKMRFCAENCRLYGVALLYKQSIELSGSNPSGVFFPGRHEGGSMEFDVGSTFSESSIRSAEPSQFIWNLVTRGFDAKMFLWSCEKITRIRKHR